MFSRQLAAIMFTDIVGYTALMGEDEQKAFELLRKNRKIQQPLIDQYNGKWIKELGDGILASFQTGTDAVFCAGAIQHACITTPGLRLRIGIHLGDILFENNDVFGDGVNIASRLQALAPIGSIWISESVHKNISNKRGICSSFIGEEFLKNVKETVRIYEVKVEHADYMNQNGSNNSPEPVKKIPAKSIAVLPFVNMSNDPEQEYFSDGMAEEILNSLVHIKQLKVAGRTSSFQFKGKNIDLREVGDKLGVATVLEGSVRKQGNKLRITAQLINVEDGFHLWSEKYDRDMDDIFAIQDEIAMAITRKLKITLLEKEKDLLLKNPTDNKEAYVLYLKGRFFWNRRGFFLQKGLGYFQQAIEIDPYFTLAHAGIADSYALLSLYCLMSPHNAMPKARQAAEKAIELDPSLAEPYASLGFVYAIYDWDWVNARNQFLLSLEINPNYATGHYWYSFFLSWVKGETDTAVRETLRAIELEPISWIPYNILAVALTLGGRFEEAIKSYEKAIELDPNVFMPRRNLAAAYIALDKYPDAIAELTIASQISGRHQLPLFELCIAYVRSGNVTEAEKIYDELILRSHDEYISAMILCGCAYSMGKTEDAYTFLDKAFEDRDGNLPSLNRWPTMSAIKDDPYFTSTLKKLNLPNAGF